MVIMKLGSHLGLENTAAYGIRIRYAIAEWYISFSRMLHNYRHL